MQKKSLNSAATRAFTRCEHCQAVLPLDYVSLAQAGGMVRCGSCGRTLNGLACLYPAFPDGSIQPISPSGMPPMLQPHVEQEQILDSSRPADVDDDAVDHRGPVLRLDIEPEPAPAWVRLIWPALAVLLVALLALQLAGPQRWRLDPEMLGLGQADPIAVQDAIQLISRDMHAHPSLNDAVVISAVLVNRSDRSVAWPNIELRLFDASQQTVAQKRLSPNDYLAAETNQGDGFAPGLRLPIVLEVSVESSRPSGFSMRFYSQAP
ncbi:MAG TPA: zinc-ribbon and DUF3426 domain-containing protein [Wenzhouxiangellaceae bacterium]|nr:zinc-ribbon and DUF3426 domain-containing protein [Wenzhouxiangellaceae bacterium]